MASETVSLVVQFASGARDEVDLPLSIAQGVLAAHEGYLCRRGRNEEVFVARLASDTDDTDYRLWTLNLARVDAIRMVR